MAEQLLKTSDSAALIRFFRRYAPLTSEEAEHILAATHLVDLAEGAYFSRAGRVSQEIGFLEEGVLRVRQLTPEGDERTMYFLDENHFVVDLESYRNRTPCDADVQAVTDCRLRVIGRQAFDALPGTIPGFPTVIQRIIEDALLEKVRRRSPLVSTDAATRYENFLRDQPGLANRVPLQYVASYLGMAPQSLSRIRRQLARSQAKVA
jgi:CRP-like cAMP-binding protein